MYRRYYRSFAIIALVCLIAILAFNQIYSTDKPTVETVDIHIADSRAALNGMIKDTEDKDELKTTAGDGAKAGEKTNTIMVEPDLPAPAPSIVKQQPIIKETNHSSVEISRGADSTVDRSYPQLSKNQGSFGQFQYRDTTGGSIQVDPIWIAANIVTITLPGLNMQVQVNRAVKDNFIQAFTYIKNGSTMINGQKVSLLSLINTMDGTFVTRHVNWNPARGLSNHSWGIAIDINADDHFRFIDSAKEPNDPNLILWEQAFKLAGFSWGNSYDDSMHYEVLK